MKNIFYVILSIFLLNVDKNGCERGGRFFNTESYHKKTLSLKKDMAVVDSLTDITGIEECLNQAYTDSLFLRYGQFCFELESYDLPDNGFITVDDCVVKEETINLKTANRARKFKKELEVLDSFLQDFSTEVDSFIKVLENDCVKKYNLCRQLKKEEENKNLMGAIKQLVKYKSLTDDELLADSLTVLNEVREAKALTNNSPGGSQFLRKLSVALTNDLKYIIDHRKNRQLCDDAHIRWAFVEQALIHRTYRCEVEYLAQQSSKNWALTVDSTWLAQQVSVSRECAIHPRGCRCENASNFDSLAVLENETCIGCMDPFAVNYCPSAKIQRQFSCIYEACTNRCFAERIVDAKAKFPNFVAGRDTVMNIDSLCINYWCGCTNPCASNYDSAAVYPTIPDSCQGVICGCLDSTYVNDARRNTPDWARHKYFDPRITKHDSTLCHFRGCTSVCALNYDPRAKINDGSCICEKTSDLGIEKLKKDIILNGTDITYDAQILQEEFDQFISKNAKKYSNVDFRPVELDLVVDVEFSEMKIHTKGQNDGIPLGDYHFKPVDELVDGLIRFLNFKTANLLSSMLEVKIVGEADGHPISGDGIKFLNGNRPINGEVYMVIDPHAPTDIRTISDDNFDLTPNSPPVNLSENDVFRDNLTLAYLRAYLVKQQIRDADPLIEESMISIGAKANIPKGKQYRRIGVSMVLSGYFEVMSETIAQNSDQLDSLNAAEKFYTKNGWPVDSTITYARCPCYL